MWLYNWLLNSFVHTKVSLMKNEILIQFGEKVRELRKEKGLSQEELAFKADLHRTYIGMIERAEKNITLLNIERLAKALEVNPSIFFNEQ